jgi:hypothetical protein
MQPDGSLSRSHTQRLDTGSDSVMQYWDGFLTVRTLGMMYKLENRKLQFCLWFCMGVKLGL